MNMMKHIQTWLLITLLALSANGVANAKVASGPQNLGADLHQSQTVLNALLHQGLEQVSTTSVSGSPLATKGGPSILRSVGASVNTGMTFTRRQLQKKFASHGDDFGVFGNANNQTLAQFESAILRHTGSESTLVIQGTYRGTQQVTHFFNPNTGLNVIRDADGAFLSGWKLGRAQIENIIRSGNLQ